MGNRKQVYHLLWLPREIRRQSETGNSEENQNFVSDEIKIMEASCVSSSASVIGF